ncbi:class I SAM-dependent methyltransferase [Anaerolinea thermophila]|uniref:class I SAM-dependent methyltransferase n=2 Tax=Anaerolinea TaxID=233189 RepID=UPI0026EDA86E|nr:class I SAM-dependent methyltransferase [Anaerolinea thermophila]
MNASHSPKAALRGEPSYVWRAGQERRLKMMLAAAGERISGRVLVDGCGVGMYLARFVPLAQQAVGLDIEHERTVEAHQSAPQVVCGAGEALPFPANHFDFLLSHEVLEHVQDDAQAIREMVRVLKPGGRIALFCPNRGYPFETHGIYWRGRYHFGNIPLVNYLPRRWRDRLAPHVRVYTAGDLQRLFAGLPVRVVQRSILFGAYDNIIARLPALGKVLRAVLQALETTPLRVLGLSHFWVIEKIAEGSEIAR